VKIQGSQMARDQRKFGNRWPKVRLPDVLERQGLFLNLLLKLVMPLILAKHFVVLEYFATSLKVLEQLLNCSSSSY